MRIGKLGRSAVVALLVTALVGFFAGAGTASAAPAPAAQAAPALTAPITGTFTDASGGTGTAVGSFTPTGFTTDGTSTLANGVADLTMVDSASTSRSAPFPRPSPFRSASPRRPARSSTWCSARSTSTCSAWSCT